MVLAPAVVMFSSAAIWAAVSPSCLPAAVSSLAPSFLASASAPSFIFTKKGLVSVLVIRPITGSPAAKAPEVNVNKAAAAVRVKRMGFSWSLGGVPTRYGGVRPLGVSTDA